MDPLDGGGVLEVRSREGSVREDLPAWCRMVGHTLLGTTDGEGRYVHYFLRKKGAGPDAQLVADLEQAREYRWQTRVRWTAGMTATAYVRNHQFVVGQPASFDTDDPAPSAIEYLLAAMGGALIVALQWRLSQRRIEVLNLEFSLNARSKNILAFLGLEEGDSGLESIVGRAFVHAVAEADDIREVYAETLRRCPITNSLRTNVPVDIELRIV
jgi:uncharacterized OsmC-like protein